VGLLIGSILLVIIETLVLATPSYGQASRWYPAKMISGKGQLSWFPDIAVDQSGKVHIVWSSGLPGYDVVMYASSPNGQDWSQMNDIVALPQTAGSEASRPALLVDSDGVLHMTYRYTNVFYSNTPLQDANSAPAWGKPILMSNPAQIAYFSDLALDHEGGLHLVLTWNMPTLDCPICYHVFYRYSVDHGDSWSEPLDISGYGDGAAKPEIVVDSRGNLLVTWESGIGGSYGAVTSPVQVKYAASYDRGKTWISPQIFDSPSPEAVNVCIGQERKDRLVAVWQGVPDSVIYYKVSKDFGRSWSKTNAIPDIWGSWPVVNNRLDRCSMASDSLGKVHLVIAGRGKKDQTTIDLLHSIWDGNAWIKSDPIATYSGDDPEWPRIVIGNGDQIHVTWFVRDFAHISDSDRGEYRVWYKHGIADAPALPTRVYPTVPSYTPSVETSTPKVKETSTPTAIPLGDLKDPPIQVNSTAENFYLSLFGLVLIPCVLLIAIVVFVRYSSGAKQFMDKIFRLRKPL